ncbi:MAG: tetratricopeptide repeat protein [Verrucomicrobiia bacterium]
MPFKKVIIILTLLIAVLNVEYRLSGASESAAASDPGLDIYYSANALYNRNLYELAITEYKNFLSKYPDHSKATMARLGLAMCYYATGKYADAEPLLANLITTSTNIPQPENVRLVYAQTLLMLKKFSEAEKILTPLSETVGKTNEVAIVCLAETLFNQKKYDLLAEKCKRFVKLFPNSEHLPRVVYLSAIAEFEQKNFKNSAEVILPYLKQCESTPMAHHLYFLLGECYRELGDMESAAKYYDAASKRFKGEYSAEAAFRLGWTRFAQKKYDSAIEEIKNFFNNFKESSQFQQQAGLVLARAYMETGDFKKADQTFKSLVSNKKPDAETVIWYCRFLQKANRAEEAINYLSNIISKESDATLADAALEFANSLMNKGNYEQAASLYSKVAASFSDKPQAAEALYMQAVALHKAGKYSDSLKLCEAFLKKFSSSSNAGAVSFLQCENLFFLNKYDEALNCYRRYVKDYQKADVEGARLRIAQILHWTGRYSEALTEAQALLKNSKKPETAAVAGVIAGDCYYQNGNWKEAVNLLEKTLSSTASNPYYESGMFRLALAYEKQGEIEKAIEKFRQLISKYGNSSVIHQAKTELARIYYEKGELKQARSLLQEVVNQQSERGVKARAENYLALCALKEKNEDEALKIFARVADNYRDTPIGVDASYQQGIILFGKKDYDSARAALEKYVNANPPSDLKDNAILYIGLCYEEKKEYDRAIAEFKKIQNNKALRERALYEWGWCEKSAGRTIVATKIYEQLISEYPRSKLSAAAMLELAEADYSAKKYDSAIERLNMVIKRTDDPKTKSAALFRKGWCLFNMENWLESANVFEEYVNSTAQINPDLVSVASYQAGEARMKLREYSKALSLYKNARKSASGEISEQSMLRIGECYALLDNWQESLNNYTLFIQKYPKSRFIRQAYFGIGWAYENMKKYNQAKENYKKAIDLDSVKDELSARCQFQIGECAMAEGNYDEAIRELTRVDVNYPFKDWRSRAVLEIARALEAKNQLNNAKERYKEIIQKYQGTDAEIVAREKLKKLEQK